MLQLPAHSKVRHGLILIAVVLQVPINSSRLSQLELKAAFSMVTQVSTSKSMCVPRNSVSMVDNSPMLRAQTYYLMVSTPASITWHPKTNAQLPVVHLKRPLISKTVSAIPLASTGSTVGESSSVRPCSSVSALAISCDDLKIQGPNSNISIKY